MVRMYCRILSCHLPAKVGRVARKGFPGVEPNLELSLDPGVGPKPGAGKMCGEGSV